MTDLSQDELTVLLIAAKGEPMIPIGRWDVDRIGGVLRRIGATDIDRPDRGVKIGLARDRKHDDHESPLVNRRASLRRVARQFPRNTDRLGRASPGQRNSLRAKFGDQRL